MFEIQQIPSELYSPENSTLFTGILRGAERECLRVTTDGQLAKSLHPEKLGSALTHPQITTDFSEALLEFITPPSHRAEDLLAYLENIQRFVTNSLDNELLWTTSMPCKIEGDDKIPVALYGDSNIGKMKTIYRVGLGHRYGRTMQTVAGVHYNFSLPNAFWAFLHAKENSLLDLQDFRDQKYFALIRNFRRYYWLLIYLFGASPAISSSFVKGREHNLEKLEGLSDTIYLPYATSLRMGDLGYQSSAQESLFVCYNRRASYISTLCCAITRKHADYEKIGIEGTSGDYKQLNTSLLQIENEFYSAIRPKRTGRSGETALSALENRGVEYIEVRCLDVNPFEPLGISQAQIRFLDTFLVYCALKDSPMSDKSEFLRILGNQKKVVHEGRKPGAMLEAAEGKSLTVQDWGKQLICAMQPVAELLDKVNNSNEHQASLEAQLAAVEDSNKTLSGRLLSELQNSGEELLDYTLQLSKRNAKTLTEKPQNEEMMDRLAQMAEESLAEQKALEEAPQVDFDKYLKNYYQQYKQCRQATLDSDC